MARMSLDDGLVMQIHPGAFRNHNARLFENTAATRARIFRMRTDYVQRAEAVAGPLRQRSAAVDHPVHAG